MAASEYSQIKVPPASAIPSETQTNYVGAFLEGLFQVMIKGFQLEGRFREIDEEGVCRLQISLPGGRRPSAIRRGVP